MLKTRALPIVLFASFVLMIAIFYSTPIRQHCEDYFFDMRTRIKPRNGASGDVIIIGIDQKSISSLAGSHDGNLSVEHFNTLLREVSKTNAKAIAALLFENVVDFTSPRVVELTSLLESDERFFVGTLSSATEQPSVLELPAVLAPLSQRVFGANTFKSRSNAVVRSMPTHGYFGMERKALLPWAIQEHYGTDTTTNGFNYYLNYWNESDLKTISAVDFMMNPKSYHPVLNGKFVVVGYTVFRPWYSQTRDQIFANTPIQGDLNTFSDGEPLTVVTANAIDNLLADTWLRPTTLFLNIFQTLVIALLCFGIWYYGAVIATFTILATWVILVIGHSYLFEWFSLYVPLTDTFMLSSSAMMIGGILRLHADIKNYARRKVISENAAEIARVQSKFLDDFAEELTLLTSTLFQSLKSIPLRFKLADMPAKLVNAAITACEEFREYLTGIKQLSALDSDAFKKVKAQDFALRPFLRTLAARFDVMTAEHRIQLHIDCPSDLIVHSSPEIIDTVIYNFVANAIKYSPNDTSVVIRVKADPNVRIDVVDEGPGIPEELRDKVFEKFYRIKNDSVYKVKGTGLGLYLCRYFASRIGATVSHKHNKPQGSIFSLQLEAKA